MFRHQTRLKRKSDEGFEIASVGSMVFLFKDGRFVNVWHVTNLDRTRPGELDINEGKANQKD